jgi:non-specific serine/threonine protein kinase
LFEARAVLVRPGFKVAASNRHQVTEICQGIDRLPLAIELAAARVRMLTEQEILSQLTDRFHLLTGGSRTAPQRLQALSAAIDWSYRLLTKEEAMLFRRLSVFRGGFTLESAQAVCADGVTASVLDLIAGLVQKSMVMVERADSSGSRYRLLESQLLFAEDRLGEAAELELVRRRHYEYFKTGLSARTTSYMGPQARRPGFDEAQWLARESGNLWAAMAWARNSADDLGLGLATDLALNRLGDIARLRSLLDELLTCSPAQGWARVHALGAAFNVAYRQGEHEAAVAYAEREVALARDLGDLEEVAQALHFAGIAHTWRGEFARANEVFAEATSLLKDSPNYRLVNFIRTAIAYLLVQRGDCTTAGNILAECLATTRADGDVSRTAYHLDIFASAQLGLNEPRAAAASWKEALSIQRGLKKQLGVIDSLIGLSRVAEACRDDRRGVRLSAAATRLSGEMSYTPDPWMLGQLECSRRACRDRLGVRVSEKAWKEGWSMSSDRAADYALDENEFEGEVDTGLLSRREREVASLVAAGLTNRQIGERLFISWRTVEGHVERIRSKLNARSRTQVATWAAEHGLTRQVAAEPARAD